MGDEKSSSMPMFAVITVGSLVVLSLLVLISMNGINEKLVKLDNDVSSVKESVIKLGITGTGGTGGTGGGGNGSANGTGTGGTGGSTPSFNLSGKTPRGTGTVTIVEYSDFQCPYCSRAEATMQEVLKQYEGKVKVYFKQFPLSQIHPNAQKAAEASECAADQGKFWEYHDKLFANQNALNVTSLKKYAGELGLDQSRFDTCLDSNSKAGFVSAQLQEGVKNGVQGTPSFFINGKILVGAQPITSFQAAIEQELKK